MRKANLREGSTRTCRSAPTRPWKRSRGSCCFGRRWRDSLFGLIGFGEIAEDYLRTVRNSFHPHRASGQLVVVKIDDRSLQEYGSWPWPRKYHARLVDALGAAGARQIFFDINFPYAGDRSGDLAFANALKRSGPYPRHSYQVRATRGGQCRFPTAPELRGQCAPGRSQFSVQLSKRNLATAVRGPRRTQGDAVDGGSDRPGNW